MTEKKQIKKRPKSAKGDWWGGLFCLGFGTYFLLLAVRDSMFIPYKRYGASDPLSPWQVIGIGGLFFIMGVYQLVIAIRKTNLMKQEKSTQNKSSDPT